MSLNFKVYWDEKNEARRFRMDENICTNFLSVKQKISAAFQFPDNCIFKVTWKDEEDFVTISSDEEIIDAIGNRKKDFLKLFVQVTDREDNESIKMDAEQNESLHRGVSCDGCESPIEGNRFKCLLCPDYDLCSTCFNECKHPDHDMVVFRRPADLSMLIGEFRMPGPPFHRGRGCHRDVESECHGRGRGCHRGGRGFHGRGYGRWGQGAPGHGICGHGLFDPFGVLDPTVVNSNGNCGKEKNPEHDKTEMAPTPTSGCSSGLQSDSTNGQQAQSLQMMLSMGFNDDSGWLSQLLQENNGDINATLTAIQKLAKRS